MTTRNRMTVKIKMSDDVIERDFHLFEDQIPRFVAKIERDGGTVRVVPLMLGSDLTAMLFKVGVNISAIH